MDDVTASVIVEGGCSGPNRTTTLRLAWSRRDPLAVRLLLTCEPDHPALPRGHWAVLRDFLRYGCDHPTGDGLVRIRPDGPAHVLLELVEGKRASRVTLPVDMLHRFLDATEELCPSGEERHDTAIDALIDRLLRA
ncbi:MAG TPA: SsgA family sporulation/cell division regulator [Mycobacteriales bacterium]|nr:SsgA family sporulation/cell division regulator [Mycobacteriales bacterium]